MQLPFYPSKAGVEALEKAVKADDDMMEPPKAGEADKADTDMMEMAAVSPKKHVVKKSSSYSHRPPMRYEDDNIEATKVRGH